MRKFYSGILLILLVWASAVSAAPDLVIDSLNVEPTTVGGRPALRYIAFVKNIGDSDASKSRLQVSVSPSQPQSVIVDNELTFQCTQGSSFPIPGNDLVPGDVLPPGESERMYDYFQPVIAGEIKVTAIADHLGEVTESDETNNVLEKKFQVNTIISQEQCPLACTNKKCIALKRLFITDLGTPEDIQLASDIQAVIGFLQFREILLSNVKKEDLRNALAVFVFRGKVALIMGEGTAQDDLDVINTASQIIQQRIGIVPILVPFALVPDDIRDIFCTDNDGGKNPFVASNNDLCLVQGGAFITLQEHFCELGEEKSETIQCAYGCESVLGIDFSTAGRCKGDGTIFQCTDSDGVDFSRKGTVQANGFTKTDFCSIANNKDLFEWTCADNKFQFQVKECEGECVNGACGTKCNVCNNLKIAGDSNNDCLIDISDVVFILDRLFLGGEQFCNNQDYFVPADTNGDKLVDISDVVYLLVHLFQGGPAPVELPPVIVEEAVNLATASQQLHYKSKLNDARTVITKNELPTLLADGVLTDDTGTRFRYSQTVLVGGSVIEFGTSGGDLDDPSLHIEVGTSADAPAYSYRIEFDRPIDITNLIGGRIFLILQDNKYAITSANRGNKLILISGLDVTINEGESKIISIAGEEHTVEVRAITQVSSTDKVSVSVDGGAAKEISEGSSSKIGGILIHANNIVFSAREGVINSATLIISTDDDFITIASDIAPTLTVAKGIDEDVVTGVKPSFDLENGLIKAINFQVAMQSPSEDHIELHSTFTDPVFGRLKIEFADVTPDDIIDAREREEIKVDTNLVNEARITFRPATARLNLPIGCVGGGGPGGPGAVTCSNTFSYAMDVDTSTATVTPRLSHKGKNIINVEGDIATDVGDMMVLNSGDNGRIVEVSQMPDGILTASSKVVLRDFGELDVIGIVMETVADVVVGTRGEATLTIDGEIYHIKIMGDKSSMMMTWGSGSSPGDVGDVTTIYPRIKTSKGAWVSFLNEVDLESLTQRRISLPGIESLSVYQSGFPFPPLSPDGSGIVSFGGSNVHYFIKNKIVSGIDTNNDGQVDCDFSLDKGPAILIQEEKKINEAGNSNNGDIICIPLTTFGVGPVEIAIDDPSVSGIWSSFNSFTSDPFKRAGVTRYGSIIIKDTRNNEEAVVLYPDEQMFADILMKG